MHTILIVAPKGKTNRVTRLSTLTKSSMQRIETGKDAPLKAGIFKKIKGVKKF